MSVEQSSSSSGLAEGLQETFIAADLEAALHRAADWSTVVHSVDDADAPHVLARHVGAIVQRALEARSDHGERLTLVRDVLGVLGEHGAVPVPDEKGAPRQLLAAHRRRALTQPSTVRPATPLSEAALLTNSTADPSLAAELRAELASADRVDLLCAFVKWSGLRLMESALADLKVRGVPFRVITTTYMGATERRALDALVDEFGAEVKVIYETTRTRLHAKAWVVHRATGFSTAYVGSSNLSRSALLDGLEWNVRLSAVANRPLLEKFDATFDSYWASSGFETYLPGRDGGRLDAALAEAGGQRGPGTPVDLSGLEVTPRPHQQEMLEQLAGERQLHDRHRNLVVAATGTGKTVLAAFDYRQLREQHGRDLTLLFVAHRRELLEQALRTYREVLGDGAFGELLVGGERPRRGQHVFASVQSLSAEVLGQLDPHRYDVVVLDECHHASASSYQRILERLQPVELLGLTATPERADGQDVLALFDGRTATELRLWDALADDLLVPFHYFAVDDGTDLRDLTWRRGGYDVEGLTGLYTGDDARVRIVLRELRRRVGDVGSMRAIGFCVSVEHARYTARVFREAGIDALAVSGDSAPEERAAALRRLKDGEVRVLFAVDLYNEGVDVPQVDTVLFLRPTESATVFLQQLGRGLRTAPGKAVLTALDFVGHQNAGFRFDARFRALTGVSRGALQEQAQKGFPFLPAGCSIVLDEVVQERVVASIKRQLSPRAPALVDEVRAQGSGSIADFLASSGLSVRELLGSNRSWTALRRRAGVESRPSGPLEASLLKRVRAVTQVDDRLRRDAYHRLLSDDVSADALSPLERHLAGMLTASLWPSGAPGDLPTVLEALRAEPAVRDELSQLVDLAFDAARHPTAQLTGDLADLPLSVHARYSRDEIVSALGVVTDTRPPMSFREGVVWAPRWKTDALLITLVKSEGDYSPTTMYRDYPLTRELFHWESQSRTTVASPTGQRYLHHRRLGTHVLLFVRQHKQGDLGAEPYLFLGPADYASHRGERPISITWRLHHAMPMDFFTEAALVNAG
nr:DEAD/DEAH box helicase [Kineococcus indalonis]